MGGLKLGKEAQSKFDEARQSADYSGHLEKKGAKRKNWNNRWFVLKENYLFYCKTPKSNPQGIINLHSCTVSKTEGPTARPYSFSLLAPKSVSIDAKWTNRTYFMAAKSEEDRDNWMKVLEESGRKAVERAAAAKKEREIKDKEAKLNQQPAASSPPQKKTIDSDSDDNKPTKKGTDDPSSGESSDEKADKDSDKEDKVPKKGEAKKEEKDSDSEEEKKTEQKTEEKTEQKTEDGEKKKKKHHKHKGEKSDKGEKKKEKEEQFKSDD